MLSWHLMPGGMMRNIIIGAGPAGLSAAYNLSKHDITSLILEKDTVIGGLSKTISKEYDGETYKTDAGPHRFFSQNPSLYKLIEELLGDDWVVVDRLTRQFIDGKYFSYPVDIVQALRNVNPFVALKMVLDYANATARNVLAGMPVGEGESVYIVSEEGRLIAHRNPSVVLRGTRFQVPAEDGLYPGLDSPQVVLAFETIQFGEQSLRVVAEKSTSEAFRLARNTMLITAVAVLAGIVLAAGAGLAAVRRIVRPIEDLSSTVQLVAAGDFTRRVEVARHRQGSGTPQDEIGRLATSFNRERSPGDKTDILEIARTVSKIVDFVKARDELDGKNIGFVGISLGAIVGLTHGVCHPDIKCVIALAGLHSFVKTATRKLVPFTPDWFMKKSFEWSGLEMKPTALQDRLVSPEFYIDKEFGFFEHPVWTEKNNAEKVFLIHAENDCTIPFWNFAENVKKLALLPHHFLALLKGNHWFIRQEHLVIGQILGWLRVRLH